MSPQMDDRLQRVLSAYEAVAEEQVRDLQALVRIPCPPGREGAVQTWIAARMSELGLAVERVPVDPERLRSVPGWVETTADYSDRPNVLGVIPGAGGGRSLLLHAHADVTSVEPRELWSVDPWSGKIEGDRLYGRGAWDDKSACAAILASPER